MAIRAFSTRLSAAHHQPTARVRWSPPPPTTTTTTTPSRLFSAEAVSSPTNPVQVYVSRSTDPYLNLSIEHFLLRNSHPDSVVLLLYANRPCVVIGRNQNPWVEVDLGLVNRPGVLKRLREEEQSEPGAVIDDDDDDDDGDGVDDILLVRRRSGGGTVFHDAGNVNYSVICPPATFDRDKHAEMVARALRRLQLPPPPRVEGEEPPPPRVRVNERHDIVLDLPDPTGIVGGSSSSTPQRTRTFKISGSAYKLTRARSLHHGTCLLSSPHLRLLGRLLRSPAAPYIRARGVESVRSPVRNVGGCKTAFEAAVVREFLAMYSSSSSSSSPHGLSPKTEVETLDAATAAAMADSIPEIRAGVAELRSPDWVYAQTPQFVFASHPTTDDPRPRPDPPTDLPSFFFFSPPAGSSSSSSSSPGPGPGRDGHVLRAPGLQMTVRHGQITDVVAAGASGLADSLRGLRLHEVGDWRARVGSENESLGRWLNRLFGVGGQESLRQKGDGKLG